MRLGIFGGTFDPIHYGHLLLAECCREQCGLDAVWLMPAGVPPHKQGQDATPAALRIEMIELAVAGNPAFSVCRYEADRGGVNYTVNTLTHLQKEDPARELFFLMGADMFLDLPHWHKPAEICRLAVPVAVGRHGEKPITFDHLTELVSPERLEILRKHQVEMPEIGLSATDIRRRVSLGKSIRYMVPRAVEAFIESHGLYRTQ